MLSSEIDKLLDQNNRLLTEIYFDLQKHFEEKDGDETVVFIEIGTFFEVYEVNNDEEQIGKTKEFSHLLNYNYTHTSI